MRTSTNLLLAVAFALVLAGACSNDGSSDSETSGGGGSSGSGGGPTGGAGARGGSSATGGTGAKGASGGTSGREGASGAEPGTSGEGGEGGASEPNGGRGGDPAGGDGPTDDQEKTPREVCENVICPPLDPRTEDICYPPASGDGGAPGVDSGGGGEGGTGGYDREACVALCLIYDEVNVPPQCGDESYLLWSCFMAPSNWVCRDTGGTNGSLCLPQRLMLYSCVDTYS
jgi:hypothetical protein